MTPHLPMAGKRRHANSLEPLTRWFVQGFAITVKLFFAGIQGAVTAAEA
jgi:hypothetical protein